jgi:hypothetical protein
MVHPVAGAVVGTPADRAPAREATLALLAEAFPQPDRRAGCGPRQVLASRSSSTSATRSAAGCSPRAR